MLSTPKSGLAQNCIDPRIIAVADIFDVFDDQGIGERQLEMYASKSRKA